MAYLPKQRRLIATVLLTGLVPFVAAATPSTAAPSTGSSVGRSVPRPTVELLSRGTVAKPFQAIGSGIELEANRAIDVAVVRVTFPPGGEVGWHRHPGPTVVTVTSGKFSHIHSDCTRDRYTAGETFIEKGPREVGKLRNISGTTAQVVATFFVPTGANPLTIPAPPPPCRD